MTSSEIRKVVLIGAGRLAWHLGTALAENGIEIIQVCNRTKSNGETLAFKLDAVYIADVCQIDPSADLCIIAVSDSVIGEVVSQLPPGTKMVVHVSGSVDMNILTSLSENFGVFYPLQTFSYDNQVDFGKIPVCLEASSKSGMLLLKNLALKLSGLVYEIDSNQRKQLHLAAVFASNFSNFMYVIAEELLKLNQISPEMMLPLIKQTGNTDRKSGFFLRQTGPAVRNDQVAIAMNRDLLFAHPRYLEIYNLITENIIDYNLKHGKL